MKKLLLTILTLCIGTLSFTYAQKVKVTTIKYGNDAYYTGEVVKKSPMGTGKLFLNKYLTTVDTGNILSLEGTFNGTTVSDANFVLKTYNLKFKGEVSYTVEKEFLSRAFTFTLKNGSFYSLKENRQLCAVGESGISIKINSGYEFNVSGKGEVESIPTLREPKIKLMTQFAGSDNYTCKGSPAEFSINNNNYNISKKLFANQSTTIQFDNGATVTIDGNGENWRRPNGDYLKISSLGLLEEYKITLGEDYLENNEVSHKFSNGNKFFGTVAESLIFPDGKDKEFTCPDYTKLFGIESINWEWKDFLKYAKNGTLTYSDGEYYEGLLKSDKETIADNKLPESAYFTGTLYNADKSKIQTYVRGMNESQYAEYQKKQEEEKQRIAAEYAKEKATDYFKFDNYGQIAEFKITYPDLTKFIYRYDEKTNKVLENTIYYPNGDVLDNPYISAATTTCTKYDYIFRFTNEDYKKIPKDKYPNIMSMTSGRHIFKDGLNIGLYQQGGNFIQELVGHDIYVVIKETKKLNGDYAYSEGWILNRTKSSTEQPVILKEIQKSFDEYVVNGKENGSFFEGFIYYKNGNVFEGRFKLICNSNNSLQNDSRVIAFGINVEQSYDSLEGVALYQGRVTTSTGKIIEIYKNGKKLDDFDFAQVIAEEEGKVRLAQQKRDEERQKIASMVEKYGKTNVDALLRGKIIVGMPQELLVKGVELRILPYLAIPLSIDHGRSKCYDLYGIGSDGNLFNPENKGYIWITDGKVSSITLY